MQVADKLMMITMAVSDMSKAKEFYADKLGLKVIQDFRQSDERWWVGLTAPEGGANITLTTFHGDMLPGTTTIYFQTSDIEAAHKELSNKGVKVNDVKNDLFGPGSGVQWFDFDDPDGNHMYLAQAHAARAPF